MHDIAALTRRKKLVAAAAAFVVGAGLLAYSLLPAQQAQAEPPAALATLDAAADDPFGSLDAIDTPSEPSPAAHLLVYISGAVAAPDVYRLSPEARVKDLVLAAGGLSADADMERVNLAARVADGEHVVVPRVGAGASEAGVGEDAASAGEADQGADGAGLIDINQASAEELDALPGVGPAIAARIVEHREANGPFRSVEDLQQVKGIGASVFEKIMSLVTAGP